MVWIGRPGTTSPGVARQGRLDMTRLGTVRPGAARQAVHDVIWFDSARPGQAGETTLGLTEQGPEWQASNDANGMVRSGVARQARRATVSYGLAGQGLTQ